MRWILHLHLLSFSCFLTPYAQAIKHDPTDHVFFSNRSAAYLSKGDAMHALEDAEQCVKIAPAWGKGFSRLGAAQYALRDYDAAVKAYEDGLKVEPSSDVMKEGLEDAKQAQARARSRPAGGAARSRAGDPFGPDMVARIAANPRFAPYLADEAFVAKLRKISDAPTTEAKSAALTEALSAGLGGMGSIPGMPGGGAGGPQDPRLTEVIMYLLSSGMPGGPGGMGGAGMPGMDEDDEDGADAAWESESKGEDARAAYEAAEARRKAAEEEAKKRKAAQEAEAKAKAEAEAEASMSEEEKAKKARKREAVAKKEEGNKAYKARDFDGALRLYGEAYALDDEDITYLLNTVSAAIAGCGSSNFNLDTIVPSSFTEAYSVTSCPRLTGYCYAAPLPPYHAITHVDACPNSLQAAALYEKSELDECIATCKKALERGAEIMAPFALKAKAWARIGNAEQKRGNLAAAVEAYESSLLESHTEDVYEKCKKAKAEMKKAAELAYRDPAKAVEAKERGNEAFKAGNFKKAIEEYSEAIKRDPEAAVYYANRAAARCKVLDFANALDDCDKCLKLDPKFVRGHIRKGNVFFGTREYHKALDCFKAALELDEDSEEAREGLQRTIAKINESSSKGELDPERAKRAMADPEIQAVMRDPMVSAALEDLQRDPSAGRRIMSDPSMAAKIQKLVAAGIVGMR